MLEDKPVLVGMGLTKTLPLKLGELYMGAATVGRGFGLEEAGTETNAAPAASAAVDLMKFLRVCNFITESFQLVLQDAVFMPIKEVCNTTIEKV